MLQTWHQNNNGCYCSESSNNTTQTYSTNRRIQQAVNHTAVLEKKTKQVKVVTRVRTSAKVLRKQLVIKHCQCKINISVPEMNFPDFFCWFYPPRLLYWEILLFPNNRRRDSYITGIYHMQWIASGSVVGTVCDFFVCVWNSSGPAERTCAKFTGKKCLVPHLDEFECHGQSSRSPGTKKWHFRPLRQPVSGLCLVKNL